MTMFKQCVERMAGTGFFEEWAVHVENGVEPILMAQFFLEVMRSQDNEKREAFTAFLTLIGPRPWADVLSGIIKELGDERMAPMLKLPGPRAEEFFQKFRRIVTDQVSDYWKEYAASHKQQALEVISDLERTPLDKFEGRIRAIVAEQMTHEVAMLASDPSKLFTKEMIEPIIREIRRQLEEGEDWKRGGDPEKE